MTHTLIIGGTGMLRETTLGLAKRFDHVTAIARTASSLAMLEREAPTIDGQDVDYRDNARFDEALRTSIEHYGSFDCVVAWIHDDAPEAVETILRHAGDHPVLFVHVLSCAMADPSAPDRSFRPRFERFPTVTYREVILGFVRTQHGSRWLTHDEISHGALQALDSVQNSQVVGVVEPWSERP